MSPKLPSKERDVEPIMAVGDKCLCACGKFFKEWGAAELCRQDHILRPTRRKKTEGRWFNLGQICYLEQIEQPTRAIMQATGMSARSIYNKKSEAAMLKLAIDAGWKGEGRARDFMRGYHYIKARYEEWERDKGRQLAKGKLLGQP